MSGPAARRIREARPEDAEAIVRCHVRSWQVAYRGLIPDEHLDRTIPAEIPERTERVAESLREPRNGRLVVYDGERLAGFAALGACRDDDAGGRGEIRAIYLDPDFWGRGHGRALMAAAEQRLLADGFRTASLWVLEANERARRFYEIAGWTHDGGRRIVERPAFTLPEIRYRKELG